MHIRWQYVVFWIVLIFFVLSAFPISACCATGTVDSDPAATVTPPTFTRAPGESSGQAVQRPVVATCTALTPEAWGKTPGQVDVKVFADQLGVTEAEVRDGRVGVAACDPPLPSGSFQGTQMP